MLLFTSCRWERRRLKEKIRLAKIRQLANSSAGIETHTLQNDIILLTSTVADRTPILTEEVIECLLLKEDIFPL